MDIVVAGYDRIAALRKEADELQMLVEAVQAGVDARQELNRRLAPSSLPTASSPAPPRSVSKK